MTRKTRLICLALSRLRVSKITNLEVNKIVDSQTVTTMEEATAPHPKDRETDHGLIVQDARDVLNVRERTAVKVASGRNNLLRRGASGPRARHLEIDVTAHGLNTAKKRNDASRPLMIVMKIITTILLGGLAITLVNLSPVMLKTYTKSIVV
jgi:hypothetical protein